MRPPGETARCLGILGLLFGHKYVKTGWKNVSGNCFRCGKPEGTGWVRAS